MRFNHPQPLVDPAGNLREEVRGIGIIKLVGLVNRQANLTSESSECLRKGLHVGEAFGNIQWIFFETRA